MSEQQSSLSPESIEEVEIDLPAAEEQGTSLPSNDHPVSESAEEAERQRRSRPGKLERRLARQDQELQETRRALEEERASRVLYENEMRRMAKQTLSTQKTAVEREEMRLSEEAKRAFQEGNAEVHGQATTRLAEIQAIKREIATRLQIAEKPPQQPRSAPTYSDSAKEWMAANPWFGKDRILTQQAQVLHEDAVAQGIVPDTPAYWKHLNTGVERFRPGTVRDPFSGRQDRDDEEAEEVPDRTEAPAPASSPTAARTTPARAPAPAVTRSAAARPAPPREHIRLTQDQTDIARMMGLTPQQYAAGLATAKAAGKIGAR